MPSSAALDRTRRIVRCASCSARGPGRDLAVELAVPEVIAAGRPIFGDDAGDALLGQPSANLRSLQIDEDLLKAAARKHDHRRVRFGSLRRHDGHRWNGDVGDGLRLATDRCRIVERFRVFRRLRPERAVGSRARPDWNLPGACRSLPDADRLDGGLGLVGGRRDGRGESGEGKEKAEFPPNLHLHAPPPGLPGAKLHQPLCAGQFADCERSRITGAVKARPT
jgi:hypothetical protein